MVLICQKLHEIWWKSTFVLETISSLPNSEKEMVMRRWEATWHVCRSTYTYPFRGTDPRCQGLKYFFVLPFKNSFFSEKGLSQLLLWYLCPLNTYDWQNLMGNVMFIACKLQKYEYIKHLKISLKTLFESKKLFWNKKMLRKVLTKIYKITWCFI